MSIVPAPEQPNPVLPATIDATGSIALDNTLTLPEHIRKSASIAAAGAEWVMSDDLVFARVKVVQKNDPLTSERGADGKPKANSGDIWHKNSNSIYAYFGPPPVGRCRVVPVSVQREYLHWFSRDSKKGLCAKTTDENHDIAKKSRAAADLARKGEAVKDKTAESFNESHAWLLWDIDRHEAYVAALARGNIAESISTLSMMRLRGVAMHGFLFNLVVQEKFNKKESLYYPAFFLKHIGWTEERLMERLYKTQQQMAGRIFEHAEDDTPPEAPGAAGGDDLS